jgi:flagellar hook-associated protein 2
MASIGQVGGLGSNLDVSGLVGKLMEVESKPLAELAKKTAATTVKISAYGNFKGAVSALRTSLAGLQSADSYNAMAASVVDSNVASVSATPNADLGSHSLEVTDLAVAERLKSGTFASINDVIGTGTLTIQYGKYDSNGNTFTTNPGSATNNIVIDGTNNTLAGVRDAINKSNAGVTASIVNDGTGFRLVVSGKNTGTDNSIRIGVTDGDGGNADAAGLSQLAYDPTLAVGAGKNLQQVTAAKDAKFMLDGIQIVKSGNTITDALSGVTLNLTKTNAGSPTTFSVAKDSSKLKASIEDFVKSYNELDNLTDQLTGYDKATKVAGDLNGDAAVRQISQQLRDVLSHVVSSSPKGYQALSQIGITMSRDGQLAVDNTKLQKALDTDASAVQGLFARAGKTSDPLVAYNKADAKTKPGEFALNVSQLATRGSAVGSTAAPLTIDSTNNMLDLKIDGVSSSISLTQKTYADPAALAAELQTQINGNSAFSTAKVKVEVTQNSGVLSIVSNAYGTASTVDITGGNGATTLFGSLTKTAGVDVAGSFGTGLTTGRGQTLTSADGLSVDITGGATGDRGKVTYMRGLAVELDELIGKLVDGKSTTLSSRIDSLNQQNKDIDEQKAQLEKRLEVKRDRYTQQFNTLDGLLTNMQSTMSYLSQQLASLNSNK